MKVRGRNCMCNVSGTEGCGKEKGSRTGWTGGSYFWVDNFFVSIGCWVRSLNMSLYFGVCLRL